MITEFKFPDVGEGITEGEIIRWFVKEGDVLKADESMVEVETDKANVEIPSPRGGVVLKLLAEAGDIIKVGQVMIMIGDKGDKLEAKPAEEKVEEEAPASVGVVGVLEEAPEEEEGEEKEVKKVRETKEEKEVPEREAKEEKEEKKVLAIPSVRALAKKFNIDITQVEGTGPSGRITEKDIRKYAEGIKKPKEEEVVHEIVVEEVPEVGVEGVPEKDSYGPVEAVPLRGMRRTIAKKMVKSIYTAPHVAMMDEADVTELVRLREKVKEAAAQKGVNLTYLPLIIKATVAALKDNPYINASLDDEKETIAIKKYYNIGVAVDTKDGLIVPVIKGADRKSLLELAQGLQELKVKARSRKIDLADLRGGTFTISDYGALGGLYGTPIINYPEVAILGVGKIQDRLAMKEGEIITQKIMGLSLSFDHRVNTWKIRN
jgi:pyruvate dehydrogenase E2 component (dihydrolipoamide acetyltransferase)